MRDYSYDALLEENEAFRNAVKFEINGFEDLFDMDRYVEQALNDLDIPGEFQGTIKVTLEYEDYTCIDNDKCDWVSADNEVVTGGEICVKCNAIRATQ